MPYLILRNAGAFVDFMKTVFGATEQQIVPSEEHKILHGELRIGDAVIMFADSSEQWKEKTGGMYIYVPSVDKTYTAAMENGSKSLMVPEKKDYGYTAGFEDTFGNHWWLVESAS